MPTEKRPNWLVTATRNLLVSQVFKLLFAAAGGAGILTATLGFVQGWPWASIVTYAMVSAAAGAALVGYARRAIVDAGLSNKFYVFDVQVVEEVDTEGNIIGYIPWVLLHNLSDGPICYQITDSHGQLNRLALHDFSKQPDLMLGRVEAQQRSWHALGPVYMQPPEATRMSGIVKLRIAFGKSRKYLYDYSNTLELHVGIDELGSVQATRAFKRDN